MRGMKICCLSCCGYGICQKKGMVYTAKDTIFVNHVDIVVCMFFLTRRTWWTTTLVGTFGAGNESSRGYLTPLSIKGSHRSCHYLAGDLGRPWGVNGWFERFWYFKLNSWINTMSLHISIYQWINTRYDHVSDNVGEYWRWDDIQFFSLLKIWLLAPLRCKRPKYLTRARGPAGIGSCWLTQSVPTIIDKPTRFLETPMWEIQIAKTLQ